MAQIGVMEKALRGSKEVCINFTTYEGGSIINWASNGTDNPDRFIVQPFSYFPEIFFYQWNETHYQWCGPMLLIAQYFSRFMNIRVDIKPMVIIESYSEKVFSGGFEMPHLGLIAGLASHFFKYALPLNVVELAEFSTVVSFMPTGRVMAVTRRGEDSILKQFKCFDSEVYYGIIASLIATSILMGFYKHSFKSFFSTFWSFGSLFLSDKHSIPIKTLIERQLSGVWLILWTVVLAAFSGQLIEQVIKIRPIYWIDSWDDLHAEEWRHLRIQSYSYSKIKTYMDSHQDEPMFKDFLQRTTVPSNKTAKNLDLDFDYQGIKAGKVALVMGGMEMDIVKQNLISEDFREDIDFHISEHGESCQPVFNIYNNMLMDKEMMAKWDKVIKMLRESGIYNDFRKRAMNPRKTGPDYTQKPNIHSYEFEKIFVHQLKGIFILLLIFLFISIIISGIEIFINK